MTDRSDNIPDMDEQPGPKGADWMLAAALVENLPQTVTETRLQHGWTQSQIAEYVNCHRNSISSFERGLQGIPYTLAGRLLAWIGDVENGTAVKPGTPS